MLNSINSMLIKALFSNCMKTEWRAVGMTFFAALLVLNVKLAFMAAGTLVRRIPEISKCQKCNENIWRMCNIQEISGPVQKLAYPVSQ